MTMLATSVKVREPSKMIHQNSLSAHAEERDAGRLSKRATEIINAFKADLEELWTDRQVMRHLGFMEPNAVRPRITELIKCGKLEECGSMRDPQTGKRVRVVRLRQGQQSLF